MNLDFIREEIKNHLNHEVKIKVFGMRNKESVYTGRINAIYPNIFSIINPEYEKSFSYRDIITGDIEIKYE